MSSALDASVTLEEVLAVVHAKRVPVAAELAGYLVLEIAEGADPLGAEVDPRLVYVSEEGTVALVKARGGATQGAGDAEAAVRTLLGRLLEASGSQTPALSAAARRKPGAGLAQLVLELEAALIPVNRGAGRRALARLAREVRRVTLGVGRNASAPPTAPPASRARPRSEPPREAAQPDVFDPPTTPFGTGRPATPMVTALADMALPSAAPPSETTAVMKPHSLPDAAAPEGARASVPEMSLIAVPPRVIQANEDLQETMPPHDSSELSMPHVDAGQLPAVEVVRGGGAGGGEIDSLLATFEVSEKRADHDMARDLKALVGLEPTPPPPNARESAADETDIEALLAMSDPSTPTSSGGPASGPGVMTTAKGSAASIPPVAPPAPHVPTHTDLASVEVSPSINFARVASTETPLPSAEPVRPPPSSELSRGTPLGLGPPEMRASVAIPAGAGERQLPTPLSQSRRDLTAHALRPHKRSIDGWLLLAAILALVVGVAVFSFLIRRGFLSGRTPERVAAERTAAEAERVKTEASESAVACRATLTVTDVPTHAEVLLRVGQAPVDVERMPVGTRLEFVALADGHQPRRAVLPAGATWDHGENGGPRYELAVQLDPVKRGASAELWPAAEPGSEVGGKGPPGTVRVVATPRGADVWLLAGVGPEALIEQLPCGQNVDVLLAGPTTFRRRLRVAAADFTHAGNLERAAQVSARTLR